MRKGPVAMAGSGAEPAHTWLLDIGSTVIKMCRATPSGPPGTVTREDRRPDVPPGEQALGLLLRHGFAPASDRLRACSSANGTLTVGLAGLTGRYSLAAATRAAVVAGGTIAYTRRLDSPGDSPLPLVDVLVLVGGVDGADHRHLDAAAQVVRLEEYPHRLAVWAGAQDAVAAIAALRPRHRAGNVLDDQLRARCGPLAETLRRIHLDDLVDREGLRNLSEFADLPVVPTPEAIAAAARRPALIGGTDGSVPFAVLDVGGATTDVHYSTGLCTAGTGTDSAEAPVASHVFTGLGVAASHGSLLARLSDAPYLHEFVDAVEPTNRRGRYERLRNGDGTALPTHDAFLACVFVALRELRAGGRVDLGRLTRVVVTGGAGRGADRARLRGVLAAACGLTTSSFRLAVDDPARLWAQGLAQLRPVEA